MVAGEQRESGEGNIREGSWELMESRGYGRGTASGAGGGPPPPPPSIDSVVKSHKSSLYSCCWSVVFLVVKVEFIVLFPSAV